MVRERVVQSAGIVTYRIRPNRSILSHRYFVGKGKGTGERERSDGEVASSLWGKGEITHEEGKRWAGGANTRTVIKEKSALVFATSVEKRKKVDRAGVGQADKSHQGVRKTEKEVKY